METITLVLWLASIYGCYALAQKQGRNTAIAIICGAIFSIFALIVYFFLDNNNNDVKGEKKPLAKKEKKPMSKEEIEAILPPPLTDEDCLYAKNKTEKRNAAEVVNDNIEDLLPPPLTDEDSAFAKKTQKKKTVEVVNNDVEDLLPPPLTDEDSFKFNQNKEVIAEPRTLSAPHHSSAKNDKNEPNIAALDKKINKVTSQIEALVKEMNERTDSFNNSMLNAFNGRELEYIYFDKQNMCTQPKLDEFVEYWYSSYRGWIDQSDGLARIINESRYSKWEKRTMLWKDSIESHLTELQELSYTKEILIKSAEYRKAVKFCIEEDGTISEDDRKYLNIQIEKIGIPYEVAKEVEYEFFPETKLTNDEISYINTYKGLCDSNGQLSDKAKRILERERESLGISVERAEQIIYF